MAVDLAKICIVGGRSFAAHEDDDVADGARRVEARRHFDAQNLLLEGFFAFFPFIMHSDACELSS